MEAGSLRFCLVVFLFDCTLSPSPPPAVVGWAVHWHRMAGRHGSGNGGGTGGEGSPSQVTRRNFVLGVLHGWFLAGGLAFADPYTVLPVFVRHVTGASWVVGLAAPLFRGGGFLPQIVTAWYAQTFRRQKPLLIAVMAVRFLAWVGIATATFLLGGSRPPLALAIVFALLLVFSLAGGVGAVPFQELFARLFPPTLRGRFLAVRQLGGGLLAVAAGLLVTRILERPLSFEHRYGLLFLLSAGTMALGFVALALVSEPSVEPHRAEREPIGRFLRSLGGLLRNDPALVRLLTAELLVRTIHLALPFFVLDFRSRFGLGTAFVGSALSASMAGQLVSNLWWGRLSDRLGNRAVVLAVNSLAVAMVAGALLAPSPAAALGVFAIAGAVLAGNAIGYVNFLLELAPQAQRPAYIALRGTLTAPMLFLGVPGGLLVDRIGYLAVDGIVLAGTLASVVAALALPCLRRSEG